MRWCAVSAVILGLMVQGTFACGPGRGFSRRIGPRKLTPLVFKQHVPNVPEHTITASGVTQGRIDRNDSRFKDLEPNYSQDIDFIDLEGTGADRLMTMRCKEKLNTLAISVMNQWPGTKLTVTEGWDEEGVHAPDSLHYEGRAVDIRTSDKDKSKLGMLARLAVEAGFDWVYYESKTNIHCSVKSESSQGGYGGCFTGDSTVLTSTGARLPLSDLRAGEKILAQDPTTKKLVFSEVILFLDYNPTQKRQFLHFILKSGRTLTITPYHLMTLKDGRTVYAGTLKPGDKVLISIDKDTTSEDSINSITSVLRTGVYAPLTKVGTVVINDVVASCYATVDSQRLAHWAFLPLRLVWNIKRGLYRFWVLLQKPVNGWYQQIDEINRQSPPEGIHWYAKTLYATANYLIPSHLHV
ncbi:sonic hedgehog protein [Anthonomus grandis grandis]|uniref:sonic hedgehog protein n=1 Tax=Anthonomus grandis grandis TaxID=2921223 RepID=UPI002165907E|nr:sonic hedgehog protein [Anthonomus grandis grandis]